MTRITTGCPRCGRVELAVEEITLVVSPREETAWYVFDCHGCAHRVVKPAPASVTTALTNVQVTQWTVPAEVLERVQPQDHPPLSADDLLDALLWLRTAHGPQGPDRPVELAAERGALRPPSPDGEETPPARPSAA
jgi:hypothetical protein